MNSRQKAALSYIGMYLTGILFLITEKNDEFIRKSAAQSFVLGMVAFLTHNFLMFIPLIGLNLTIIFDILFFILIVFLIIKALKNIYFKLPVISEVSEKYVMHWFK